MAIAIYARQSAPIHHVRRWHRYRLDVTRERRRARNARVKGARARKLHFAVVAICERPQTARHFATMYVQSSRVPSRRLSRAGKRREAGEIVEKRKTPRLSLPTGRAGFVTRRVCSFHCELLEIVPSKWNLLVSRDATAFLETPRRNRKIRFLRGSRMHRAVINISIPKVARERQTERERERERRREQHLTRARESVLTRLKSSSVFTSAAYTCTPE